MNIWLGIIIFIGAIFNMIRPLGAIQRIVSIITAGCALLIIINDVQWDQKVEDTITGVVDTITAGGSFCYLAVGEIDSVKNVAVLELHHKGEYPLYDVRLKVTELDKSDQFKREFTWDGVNIDVNTVLGDIAPYSVEVLDTQFPLGNGNTRRLNVFFLANNGSIKQYLQFKKVNGKWASAIKVMRLHGNKEIHKHVDPAYPKNDDGSVEW